nr:PREDICTED: probable tRNA N6-adenosine threonylcarbamoyltransferase, mitochondrial [Bemisia tabaci]
MMFSSLFRASSTARCLSKAAFKSRNSSNFVVLGIETSFDDTGCAIVNSNGDILGEALRSQQAFHSLLGGCLPPIARDLHLECIESVIDEAFASAKLSLSDIDAVATTVKPGLAVSLQVGLDHGKRLSKQGQKPFIPIHHMEAHALTARMIQKDVELPFLVALISGCHSLIAVAHSVDKYSLLGTAMDSAPGESIDKLARRMQLRNRPELRNLSGGRAIELLAEKGDPTKFEFSMPIPGDQSCNFSWGGLRTSCQRYISDSEIKHDLDVDETIPEIDDLCASLQAAICKHLCSRLQRAMEYANRHNILPSGKTLVLSGGVACNGAVKKCVGMLCDEMEYRLVVPPPHLCTDNGVMIAWNGVERFQVGAGVIHNPEEIDAVAVEAKAQLGEDCRLAVVRESISVNQKNRIRVEKALLK